MKTIFSSYKRAKQIPVHAVCRNCHTQLQGPYCHICGQNVFHGSKRSFREIAFSTLENMFAIDKKLLITLKYLLFFPGRLTKEYINGRIVRYVHPSKLFWFISIFFFMLLSYNIRKQSEKVYNMKDLIEQKSDTSSTGLKSTINLSGIPENKHRAEEGNINQIATSILGVDKEVDLTGYLTTYSPYVSFLLIPFMALLLLIHYPQKNYFYADYLAFALHFQAFVFLVTGCYLGLKDLFPTLNINSIVFLYLPAFYFIVASITVFRPKPHKLILKSFSIIVLFGLAVLIVMLTFLVTILYAAVELA